MGGFQGPGADPIQLLRNEQVKKELKLTDEQAAKVPEAVKKAIAEVLKPEQAKRLRQIELQLRGAQAFNDASVQSELKMTDEQKTSVKTILGDYQKEMAAAMKEAQGGNFQGLREKMQTLRKESDEKLQGVLKDDQKKAYKEMLGEPFKMDQPGRRRPDA
jgi:hypothetical protein